MHDSQRLTHEAFRLIAERSSLFDEPLGLDVETWRLMREARHLMRKPPRLIDEAKSINADA